MKVHDKCPNSRKCKLKRKLFPINPKTLFVVAMEFHHPVGLAKGTLHTHACLLSKWCVAGPLSNVIKRIRLYQVISKLFLYLPGYYKGLPIDFVLFMLAVTPSINGLRKPPRILLKEPSRDR